MIVVSGCQLSICIFRIHFHIKLLTWFSYVDVGYRSRISQVKRSTHFWFCFAPLLGQRIISIEIWFTSSSNWWQSYLALIAWSTISKSSQSTNISWRIVLFHLFWRFILRCLPYVAFLSSLGFHEPACYVNLVVSKHLAASWTSIVMERCLIFDFMLQLIHRKIIFVFIIIHILPFYHLGIIDCRHRVWKTIIGQNYVSWLILWPCVLFRCFSLFCEQHLTPRTHDTFGSTPTTNETGCTSIMFTLIGHPLELYLHFFVLINHSFYILVCEGYWLQPLVLLLKGIQLGGKFIILSFLFELEQIF